MKVLNHNISGQNGFSLVELAMVPVVMGLLIDGIFKRERCYGSWYASHGHRGNKSAESFCKLPVSMVETTAAKPSSTFWLR